ncbi:MAG: hypothetical protein HY706_13865 [Candidatus Hydrogenedentes bacterium]|nr:hypothetical protein [Candidatus Hydrogenedentota bacterium]
MNGQPVSDPRIAQIIAGAILLCTVAYTVASVVLVLVGIAPVNQPEPMPESTTFILGSVLSATGVMLAAASFWLRHFLESKLPREGATVQQRFTAIIVAMALSEASGALGLVYVLLIGRLPVALILFGCAIGGCIFHFPTRRVLEPEKP